MDSDGEWTGHKRCVRCGNDTTYTSNQERCSGCGCIVPLCYEPIKDLFIANVKNVKDEHKPPSGADLIDRWLGVKFLGGDLMAYHKETLGVLERASKRMRKLEDKSNERKND